ncbi:MAG TPA: NUDIX hydrolase [Jatrophihabitantaceae bacterium]|jgi:ADP-ribose pyrophosphatase|nr:NUDIX hydrolase [Jatrophihabitantaceae bacterium]
MSDDFEVVDSEKIFDGAVISVRRDTIRMPDGSTADREIVDHPGAVGIVALDDDDRVVMVNQYRPALRMRLDELPAGLLDVDGEPALDAAQRELAEEASVQAGEWHVLLDLHTSPGFSDEAIRIYLARGLSDVGRPDGFVVEHEESSMSVTRVSLAVAVQRVQAGEITNAAAAAGIVAAALARASGWQGLRPADAPWPGRPRR